MHVFGWRGVSVAIDGPDGLAQELRDHLPPFFTNGGDPIATVKVTSDDSGMLQAELPLGLNTGGPWTPQTLRMLASRIELVIVEQLPDLHAVHAGVVAFDGRAIVLPGTSHSGKSTLVRALLERGGTYLSDEFALLADDGRVRPYPRLMTIRDEGGSSRVVPAAAAHVDSAPLEVGVIASLAFDAATWQVQDASAADAVMALIANGVTVKRAPNDATAAYAAVARSARFLRGTRGEAADAAARLEQALRAH